jgi:hypothetical protein
MSEIDYIDFREKMNRGLQLAYENMLREKALHGRSVVIADKYGKVFTVDAAEQLKKFLAKRDMNK